MKSCLFVQPCTSFSSKITYTKKVVVSSGLKRLELWKGNRSYVVAPFTKLVKTEEIKPGDLKPFFVAGQSLLVVCDYDGQVYCTANNFLEVPQDLSVFPVREMNGFIEALIDLDAAKEFESNYWRVFLVALNKKYHNGRRRVGLPFVFR
ncbi:hypothetical protein Gasu2_00290 [Galdieria sulphuraria]|nr:hypothetical protein Gasu2_00290 [Galdieria sulphuraria]